MIKPTPLRIGFDFDNTIVCYDAAIAMLADELLDLPMEVPRTKLGLRDHLRATGREHEWTAFQGALYGPGMVKAQPFEGAIETMQALVGQGHTLMIVSHRSRRPYAGPPHDLHEAALGWVAERLQPVGLFESDSANFSVNFLETRFQKVVTIGTLGCQVFLDDLPEVLEAPEFPASAKGILFDPANVISSLHGRLQISEWLHLPDLLAKAQ